MAENLAPKPHPPRYQVISIQTGKVITDRLESHAAAVTEGFRVRGEGAGPVRIKGPVV